MDFFNEIPRNPGLQGKLRSISGNDPETTLLEVLTVAQGEGYDFTMNELESALSSNHSSESLEDDDLEMVLGGKGEDHFPQNSPLGSYVGHCIQEH